MDETEHEGVRILGASEAAASRPADRSVTPPTAPSRSVPTPSWDDDDEGWDTQWAAADGDLEIEGDPFDGSGIYVANEEDPDALWGDEPEVAAGVADASVAEASVAERGSAGPGREADGSRPTESADGYVAPAAAVPPVLRFEDDEAHDDGRDSWSTFANKGPRWRSGGDDFDEADEQAVASLSSAETRVGALDPDRGEASDLYSFADGEEGTDTRPPATRPKEGARVSARAGGRRPVERSGAGSPRPPLRQPKASGPSSLGIRVITGVVLAAVFCGTLKLFGTKGAVAWVALVAVLGVFEFYTSLRQRGFQPAVLLGAAAAVLMPVAAYSEGSVGIVITLMMATLATLLWYLFGVVRDRPAVNMAVTLLGVLYVGLLPSTAGLFLADKHGLGIFLGAIVGTVFYDMGGLFVGSNIGRRPLAPDISPNKTLEGLLGGCAAAFVASVVFGHSFHPWSTSTDSTIVLALVVAVMAPLGDLTESMIKRDLGIKDMGSLLPGHGGVMDRVDAMMFTVPAVYCIARWKGWA
jgi:phosphatidate cytidylyltransferase